MKEMTTFSAHRKNLAPVALLALVALGLPTQVCADPPISFAREIQPILADKCYQCHGPDASTRKAKLRLDRKEDASADRGGTPAITPGKLDHSEVYRRI